VIGELNGDNHGSENVDGLDGSLVEGVDREVALVPS